MGSLQVPIIYKEWNGGYNDAKNLLALKRNELADIRNFFVARDGHLKKRGGQAKVYATSFFSSSVAHGLYAGRIGTTRYLWSTAGTKLFHGNNNDITGTATIVDSKDKPVVMVTFKDLLIGAQNDTTVGLGAPFSWSGASTAAALAGTPPSLTVAICPFKNRLFMGNVTFGAVAYPEAVVYSALESAISWPTNQIAQIYPGTGKFITAFLPYSVGTQDQDDLLLIFKDTGLFYARHQLLGTGNLISAFTFHTISERVGCPAPLGVVEVDRVAYWPSYRGFYAMGPDLIPRYIGGPLETFWATVPKNRIPHIKVAYYEKFGQVWFFVSAGTSQTTNNRVCVWDVFLKRWVGIYDSINANVATIFIDSNLNRLVYTSDYTNYLIYEQDNGASDNGSGFIGRFKTGLLDLDNPRVLKSLRRILLELATESDKRFSAYLTLFNYDMTQSNSVQVSTSGAILDSFNLDVDMLGGSDYSQVWFRVGGQARYAQLEIVTPQEANAFDCYGIAFFAVPVRSGPGAKR